jgi:hypothetical protein
MSKRRNALATALLLVAANEAAADLRFGTCSTGTDAYRYLNCYMGHSSGSDYLEILLYKARCTQDVPVYVPSSVTQVYPYQGGTAQFTKVAQEGCLGNYYSWTPEYEVFFTAESEHEDGWVFGNPDEGFYPCYLFRAIPR